MSPHTGGFFIGAVDRAVVFVVYTTVMSLFRERENMLKVKKRGRGWQVAGTIAGQRVRQSAHAGTKEQAEVVRVQLERQILANGRAGVTFGQVAERYNEVRCPHYTVQQYVKRIAAEFGLRDVASLQLEEVRTWASRRGVGPASVRKYVGFAKTVLLYGEKGGMYDLARRPRAAVPPAPPARDRFLTSVDEVERVIACAHPDFRPLVRFLFGTGARLGEALMVTASDIVTQEGVTSVVLVTRKGGGQPRKRLVPLSKKVLADVMPLVVARPHGQLFRKAHGAKLFSQMVYGSWSDMCQKAKLHDFRPHDARRTFATLLIRQGVPPETIAKLLGHEGTAMLKAYTYLAPSNYKSVVDMI